MTSNPVRASESQDEAEPLLVAVFLIPVALEASGTFVRLGVKIKFQAPHAMLSP